MCFFPRFEYHMFCVLYIFVICLLTLLRKYVNSSLHAVMYIMDIYYIGTTCCTHIYTFILNITVFNATLSTSVFTLVLLVSATLGHHQVLLLLLLQLCHCNFAFIYFYFYICAPIHLLDALSRFLLSAQVHFSVFDNFKILNS
jgi:hypothetical protein